MKNKKSPLKVIGAAMGLAGAAAGTNHLLGRLGGLFGGGEGNYNIQRAPGTEGIDMGGAGGAFTNKPTSVVDAGSQFDPTAMSAMEGIFGDVSGRQASLGASGIYALNKHLSPLKNENELTAYKDVAEEDIPGYDDGAGGIDYEINKETPGYSDEEANKEFNRMKYITDAAIKKGAGAVITVPKNKN